MKCRRLGGFALPTVLVASIIMMMVLLSAVSTTSGVRSSIREQYYNQLSRTSADAGAAYAQSCLNANDGVPLWSDLNPLQPGTDCTGTQLNGFDCDVTPTDSRCVMSYNNNILSTFEVGLPRNSIIGWAINNSQEQKTLSAGQYHTCAISVSRQTYCWGTGQYKQIGSNYAARAVPSPVDSMTGITNSKTIAVAAGNSHTCAIAATGKAFCWGLQTSGALGNNASAAANIFTPTAVVTTNLTGDKTFKSITAGNQHSCGIASDNKAYCWGSDASGQLGNDAAIADSSVPVAVSVAGVLAGKAILSISAGDGFTCAIADDSKAYCWGSDASGQLGNDAAILNSGIPVAVNIAGVLASKSVYSISAGKSHACVIAAGNATDSLAYCWGLNTNGRLGNNSTSTSNIPVAVDTSGVLSGLSALRVSAGGNHTCMIASNNKAYCWGYGNYGQIGDATNTSNNQRPVAVSMTGLLSGKTIQSIVAGQDHTCAVASDDQAYCWGRNQDGQGNGTGGQLGDGTPTNSNVPIAVTKEGLSGNKAVSVVSKGKTGVVSASTGTIRQLYSAYTKNNSSNRVWRQVSPGYKHICAITNDGQAYCWGANELGQLGDGTTIDRSTPTPVYMGTATNQGALYGLTILSIAAGDYYNCALASDNNVYCWGSNNDGQLGNGSAIGIAYYSSKPVAVVKTGVIASKPIKSVTVGSDHACAVTLAGLAYCWGAGVYGQLGNSSTSTNGVPVAVTTSGVLTGLTILSISAGYYHTCVVASNSNAYCWGWNNIDGPIVAGQIGNNNASAINSAPVAVSTAGVLSGKKVLSIAASGGTTCVVASDGASYCWGYDADGAVGNDSLSTSSYIPATVDVSAFGSKSIASVFGGAEHNCAIASDNKAYCWGDNQYGNLGDNTGLDQFIPTPVYVTGVLSGKYVYSLSTTGMSYTTCAQTLDTHSYCWGGAIDSVGKIDSLFLTTNTNSRVPVEIYTPPVSLY